MKNELVDITKKSGIILLSRVLIYALGLMFNILVARLLGAQIYGEFLLIYSILNIVVIFCILGNNIGLMYYIPRLINEDENIDKKELMSASIVISLLISVFIFMIIYFFAVDINIWLFGDTNRVHITRWLFVLVMFETTIQICRSGLRGNHEIKHFAIGSVLFVALRMGIFAALYMISAKVDLLVFSVVAASFITMSYYLIVIWHKKLYGRISKKSIKLFVSMTVKFMPTMFTSALSIIQHRIDKLMIGKILDSTAVGIFNIAENIANLSSFLLVATNVSFSPLISKLYHKNDLSSLCAMYKTLTRWILSANLIFFSLLIILKDDVMMIFGEEFMIGATTLILVAIGQVINSATGASGVIINMSGRPKINLYINIFAIAINITMNYFLIPILGINGAALATMTAMVLINVFKVAYINKYLHLHPFSISMLKQIFYVAAAFVISYKAGDFILTGNIRILVISLINISVFVLLNLITGLESNDKLILKTLFKRTGKS